MRALSAVVLPALLLAAAPGLAQLVPDPGKPAPAGPRGAPPVSPPAGQPPGLAGKPPPLYDLPDPAPARPGPPSAPPSGPQTGPQSGSDPAPAPRAPAGKPPPLAPGERPGAPQREVSSGTGFIIGDRQALTNDHVVRDCRSIRARNAEGRDIPVTVRVRDANRDLALLDFREAAGPPLTFRSGPDVRRGEAVMTYGFPLAGMLASGPTLTTGDVSALAGLADNRMHFQISAPVQPGNSGGPLLDLSGNVVGIITSKLNAQRVAQRIGDIPQNVNFAVKGEEVLGFLRENRVRPRTASSGPPHTAVEVGEAVHPSVLFLRCLG